TATMFSPTRHIRMRAACRTTSTSSNATRVEPSIMILLSVWLGGREGALRAPRWYTRGSRARRSSEVGGTVHPGPRWAQDRSATDLDNVLAAVVIGRFPQPGWCLACSSQDHPGLEPGAFLYLLRCFHASTGCGPRTPR